MLIGQMVKGDGTDPMRVVQIVDGVAECLVIDGDGVIRRHFHYAKGLRPMREVFQPRTCWKETNSFDLLEIEREERAAAEARRQQRRTARKAKRSSKIKRGARVAA